MVASNSDRQRVHHFYVSIAKHVFEHPEHGIVFCPDNISLSDAARFGLKPLILYGLTLHDPAKTHTPDHESDDISAMLYSPEAMTKRSFTEWWLCPRT